MVQIGDKVKTGVYVLGEWMPMYIGIVVDQSIDQTISKVDVMSLHGGAPWIHAERTDHLHKIEDV
jgi:hypothetical protein